MGGTLLAYDAAFPRARVAAGPILNTPSADELRANRYPEPYRLLAIAEASTPATYVPAMTQAARAMRPLDRFIIFGHGRVVINATGGERVTTGIIMGSSDITPGNASLFDSFRGSFGRNAQAELWVCEAAAAGEAGGQSGTLLCQAIADGLGVQVLAATITQQYDTVDQAERPGGGWQSTARFLPWEGETVRFTPRTRRR